MMGCMMTEAATISTWYIDPDAEDAMADGHAPIWRHLIGLVPEIDLSGRAVLDFGCNQGGFLRHLHALRPFTGRWGSISPGNPSTRPMR